MVLIEVLVALAILGLAGLSLLDLVDAGARAVASARERERVMADEQRLLAAYTLLTRGDLDRRLGQRRAGPYVVTVQRPELTLYRIAVGTVESAMIEDLVTVVFRSEPTHAPS